MYFGAIGVDSDVCQQGHDFSLVQAVHAGYAVVLSPSSCSETYTYLRGGPSFFGLLLMFGTQSIHNKALPLSIASFCLLVLDISFLQG